MRKFPVTSYSFRAPILTELRCRPVSQSVPFVFAFMGLPIARRGRYEFALGLNGAPLRSVRLTLE
mgnify:CR=1 FL=1